MSENVCKVGVVAVRSKHEIDLKKIYHNVKRLL